jgi:hypothetical protein
MLKNISKDGPQNRGSLGFARDDKRESGADMESGWLRESLRIPRFKHEEREI